MKPPKFQQGEDSPRQDDKNRSKEGHCGDSGMLNIDKKLGPHPKDERDLDDDTEQKFLGPLLLAVFLAGVVLGMSWGICIGFHKKPVAPFWYWVKPLAPPGA